MATKQERDLSPLRQPTRKPLVHFLSEWLGDDICSIEVQFGHICWEAYNTALANWLSKHSVEWNDMSFADVLGFFINSGLKNQGGNYEAPFLLSRITCLRHSYNEPLICDYFNRLNQLNIFADIPSEIARSFISKLALYTSCGTDWLLRDKGKRLSDGTVHPVYRLRHQCLADSIDTDLAHFLPDHPDPRFLLNYP